MTASRHYLAALADDPADSQKDLDHVLRVARVEMPAATGSKVLVRMLVRSINPSGGWRRPHTAQDL